MPGHRRAVGPDQPPRAVRGPGPPGLPDHHRPAAAGQRVRPPGAPQAADREGPRRPGRPVPVHRPAAAGVRRGATTRGSASTPRSGSWSGTFKNPGRRWCRTADRRERPRLPDRRRRPGRPVRGVRPGAEPRARVRRHVREHRRPGGGRRPGLVAAEGEAAVPGRDRPADRGGRRAGATGRRPGGSSSGCRSSRTRPGWR